MKSGLLGKTLGHSFSPQIHAMLGDYSYLLFEKKEDEVEDFIKGGDWDTLNVTIPYKKTVMPYLSEISERAKKIGSVNTLVRRSDGTIYGDNTDYFGFGYLITKSRIEIKNKKVLILGSGGASVTAQAVVRDLGAKEIFVISRTGENNYDNIEKHADADVIVNTTPVGMYPKNGESAVDLSLFPALCGVVDMIYNPFVTKLLYDAEKTGIPHIGGLPMLVAQAKEAYEVFTDGKKEDNVIDQITEALEKTMKNIVLIGMPGCGKTTIGKELARITGREFIDCDEEIVKRAGMIIPEIFESYGEEHFRRIETKVCRDVCKRSSCVIATGGGIVTRERNIEPLKQNSTVVLLMRDISKLPSKGRPISQTRDIQEIAKEREPLYKAAADCIYNTIGIKETAKKIAEDLT